MQSQTLDLLALSGTRLDNTLLILQCQLMVIHLLGVTGAEVVVVLLCTFATSSTLK